MKRWKKTICMSVAVLISCMVIGATAFAATKTKIYPYNNIGTEYKALTTDTPKIAGMTMTWSARPTSGQGGTMIWVAGSDGTSRTQAFPYQVNVDPMKVSLKKDISYTSHIAARSGTVSGNAKQEIIN